MANVSHWFLQQPSCNITHSKVMRGGELKTTKTVVKGASCFRNAMLTMSRHHECNWRFKHTFLKELKKEPRTSITPNLSYTILPNIHTSLYVNAYPASITKLQHTPEIGSTCQDPEENSQCPHFNYNITQTGASRMEATVRTTVQQRVAIVSCRADSSSSLFKCSIETFFKVVWWYICTCKGFFLPIKLVFLSDIWQTMA